MTVPITPAQIRQFHDDGYLMLPGLFSQEEMDLLLSAARNDRALEENAVGLTDGTGRVSKLSLWYIPRDDIYGLFSRSARIVDTAEQLLGDAVYHYHSKMMLKEPRTGGAWVWHQDYGYWYEAGYLYPDMLSCLIAIDRASRENGCLQVLKGSHKIGRIAHKLVGDQTGADLERVEQARKVCELVYCEMEPGTALFFHSNLLHCSAANTSDRSRWSLISCYTAAHNLPYKQVDHPGYEPLVKVPDSAILEAGGRGLSERTEFLSRQKLEGYNRSRAAQANN